MQADFDPTSGLITATIDDNAFPSYQPTGATVPDPDQVIRVDVETIWPDPHHPLYPQLLGPATLSWDPERQVVLRTYPQADPTPVALRTAIAAQLRGITRVALTATDWAVIRRADTGQAIPADIAAQRTGLRTWQDQRHTALREASTADLLDFDTTIPADLWDIPTAPA